VLPINNLYCGDCLEVMQRIDDKSIDMILCDLPYGTTACKWDTVIPFEPLWAQYKRIIKDNGAIVLTASQPFTSALVMSNVEMFKYEWIWEKTQATGYLNAKKMPMKAHENILVFYKKPPKYNFQKTYGHKPTNSYTKTVETQNNTGLYNFMAKEIKGGGETSRYPRTVLKFPSDKQKSCFHSTQKPLKLSNYMVKTYSDKGDVVIDLCYGSGTTAVSCNQLERDFYGTDNGICDKKGEFYGKPWKEVAEYRIENNI